MHDALCEAFEDFLYRDKRTTDDPAFDRALYYAQERGLENASDVLVEYPLILRGELGELLFFGTVDLLFIQRAPNGENRGTVIDWKSWAVNEDAATFQGQAYSVAAMQQFHLTSCEYWFLPILRTESREYHGEANPEHYLPLFQHLKSEAESKDASLRSGAWCGYCKAAGICEETKKVSSELLKAFSSQPAKATKRALEDAYRSEIESLPVERLMPYVHRLEAVEAAVKAVRARMRSCLEQDPTSVSGWELRETKGARSGDTLTLWQLFVDTHLRPAELLDAAKFSVSKLEKLFVTSRPELTPAEAKREFAELVGGSVHQATIKKMQRKSR